AMPQCSGHDAQHPEAILVVLSPSERSGMLLDRAKLGRSLGANDRQEVTGLLLGELARGVTLLLTAVVPHADRVRRADLHLGAQAEGLVLGEYLVPARLQEVVVGHPMTAPVLHRVVVLLLERGVLDSHTGSFDVS